MSDSELLEETNRLLRKLVEIDEERRAENERAMKELEARRPMVELHNEALEERLKRMGIESEAAEVGENDWEKRLQEANRKTMENIETASARERQYKDELLAELRTQSDLLRQIVEKLGR
jgi:hypothetical protein